MQVDKHQDLFFCFNNEQNMELFFFFSKLINLSAYCIRSKWEPLRFQSLIYEGVLTLDWLQCWWINTMAWFCPINYQQSTAIINRLASLSIWSQFGHSSKLTFKVNTPCTWNCSSWFCFKTEFSWHNIDTAVLVVLKNKQEHYLNSLLERGIVAYESVLKLRFNGMDNFLETSSNIACTPSCVFLPPMNVVWINDLSSTGVIAKLLIKVVWTSPCLFATLWINDLSGADLSVRFEIT